MNARYLFLQSSDGTVNIVLLPRGDDNVGTFTRYSLCGGKTNTISGCCENCDFAGEPIAMRSGGCQGIILGAALRHGGTKKEE